MLPLTPAAALVSRFSDISHLALFNNTQLCPSSTTSYISQNETQSTCPT